MNKFIIVLLSLIFLLFLNAFNYAEIISGIDTIECFSQPPQGAVDTFYFPGGEKIIIGHITCPTAWCAGCSYQINGWDGYELHKGVIYFDSSDIEYDSLLLVPSETYFSETSYNYFIAHQSGYVISYPGLCSLWISDSVQLKKCIICSTSKNNFAKIEIIEAKYKNGNLDSIVFRWAYQNDGSNNLDNSGSLDLVSANKLQLSIFPNPSNSRTNIQINHIPTSSDLIIYNICGRLISHFYSIKENNIIWDVGGLPSGIYILNMRANKTQYSKKVVLQ